MKFEGKNESHHAGISRDNLNIGDAPGAAKHVSSILTTFVVDEANLYVGIRYLFRNFSPRHDAGGNFRLPYANLPVDDSAVSDDDAVTEPMPRWSLNIEAL